MRTLKYFMWGFQPHFRHSLQLGAEHLLKRVGFEAKPQALLVGFAASPAAAWPICIEPEDRDFQPEHLDGIVERGQELYEANPRSQMFYSDPRSSEIQHRNLRDGSRALAVTEFLERADPAASYFVGASTTVGEYQVHPVLGIPADALAVVPQLRTEARDDVAVSRSLVHSCLDVLLAAATRALYEPEPGASLLDPLGATTDELARRAGTRFVGEAVFLTGSYEGRGLFSALSVLSTTRYEGLSGHGTLFAVASNDPDLVTDVQLRAVMSLSDIRGVRKLLEMSERGRLGLLTNGASIYALGHIQSSYDPSAERIFDFHVVGDGKWLMHHAGEPLLSVEFGVPALPADRIDRGRFVDTAERLFGSRQTDAERLWELALAAADQEHGAMLVVSEAAAAEAERLGAQAILIEEAQLSPELLYRATSIDGAALFSPAGACHALGVILDGVAADEGNRARGSRFNSAVRYLATVEAAAMVVLVSEDGMIDVLPHLHPRIYRRDLDAAIERYLALTNADEPDRELRSDAYDRLEELAFYLSEDQCALINRAEEEFQDRELAGGGYKISGRHFRVDAHMNDSYFYD